MDINAKIIEFKNSQFNKEHREKENHYSSDLEYAIKKAYADMTPRSLQKAKKGDETASVCKEGKEAVLRDLSKEIKAFADNPQDNYDNYDVWHKKICDCFCKDFYEKALGEKYKPIHFGKAQKIVNMTFKYLSCFDDDNKNIFQNCHMPLDKYTLDWFFEKVCPEYVKERKPWSNLEYGSEEIAGSYKWIQTRIKQYLKNQNQYPQEPLWAEFFIWDEYRQKEKRQYCKGNCKEYHQG